ncbi:MAG: hypothetical protein MUC87_08350 [Bacteroidia bacterium]|jgi:hypothetical protein|nr:hypothetical protein [Bacteroidia bacterium]
MNIVNYIKEWITGNAGVLKISSAAYQYIDLTETHFVYISPSVILDAEENQVLLSNFLLDFSAQFPGQLLCLIDDNSVTQLDNPTQLLAIGKYLSEIKSGTARVKSANNLLSEHIKSEVSNGNELLRHCLPDPFKEFDALPFPASIPVTTTVKSQVYPQQAQTTDNTQPDTPTGTPSDSNDLFLAA